MKSRVITVLILIMVVATSVFGLVLIDHKMGHDNNGCAAARIVNMVCPDNELTMAQHHIAAVKELSDVVIPPMVMLILALFAFIATSPHLFEYFSRLGNRKPSRFYLEPNQKHTYFDDLLRWLSRFELSPSFAISAR